MEANLTVHRSILSQRERQRLRDLEERLERRFRRVLSAHWAVDQIAGVYSVSLQVQARCGFFRARSTADRIGEALDLAVDIILRQRRRHQAQVLTSRHRRGLAAKQFLTRLPVSEVLRRNDGRRLNHGRSPEGTALLQ